MSRKPLEKPQVSNSASQRELDRVEENFKAFDESVQALTHDRLNAAPREETEAPKISSKEIDKSKDIYLKPKRSITGINPKTGESQKFNERFRKDYEFQKEYVQFIAYNNEIGGEDLDLWTRPFPGMDAEEWVVPTNKPVWGPRYLAEQIKRKYYHRLKTENTSITQADGMGSYFGNMVVDTTVQRLDAHPVNQKRSIFMGSGSF